MASTYTTNLGIEKPGTGEQSGTWGDTANTNYDLIDQAINGIVQVTLAAAGSSGSPNSLDITNGTASDGRNKYIEFIDGGDLGATAYVQLDPNDAEKIVHMRNSLSGSRSVIVFQGTYNASNDFEIPAGKDVVLKFDGAGASATVTQVFVDLKLDALDAATVAATTGNITTVNATTVDTTNLEVTNIKAKDGTSAGSIADSTGVVTFASAVLTTADINGGTMDGVTIGGASTAAGSFTTVTASGRVTFGELKGTGATVVSTILDEDNMASNSDTALATQQSIKAYVDTAVQAQDTLAEILANGNTTGANNIVVTSGQVITTDTINETSAGAGVNIDSVVLKDGDVNGTIGQVTAKAANFTTMGASSNVTVGGTLGVTGAATLSSSLSVNTGAVFNEGGGDNDFRVESDTNQNMLFVDASADRVNIGASDGQATLSVQGTVQITSDVSVSDVQGYDLEFSTAQQTAGVDFSTSSPNAQLNLYAGGSPTNLGGWNGQIRMLVGGTNQVGIERLTVNPSSFVVNELGNDYDFRVESDTNTHMLFVDAANNRIGINSAGPNNNLEVQAGSTGGVTFPLSVRNALASFNGRGAGIEFRGSGTNVDASMYNYIDGTLKTFYYQADAHRFRAITGPNEEMLRLGSAGSSAVFNEGSADIDFRVESDTNANAIFLDASTSILNIGASSAPSQTPASSIHYASGAHLVSGGFGRIWVPGQNIGALTYAGLYGMATTYNAYYNAGWKSLGGGTASAITIDEGAFAFSASNSVGAADAALTWTNRLTISATGTVQHYGADSTSFVVNQGSADVDFRVESNNDTHTLFVDGGTDRVGIKRSSPNSNLDVASDFQRESGTFTAGGTLSVPLPSSTGGKLVVIHLANTANSNANFTGTYLINYRLAAFGGGGAVTTIATAQGSTGTSAEITGVSISIDQTNSELDITASTVGGSGTISASVRYIS